MKTLALGCALLGLSGCCVGPDYLSFGLTTREGAQTVALPWGITTSVTTADLLSASHPDGKSPAGPLLELFRADGSPLELTPAVQTGFTPEHGCPHTRVEWPLTGLEPGRYTVVHREKHGTGDPLNCPEPGCAWETFDGDRALQATLDVVTAE